MPAGDIIYSDRYEDEEFEYRHVNLLVIIRPNNNDGNNFWGLLSGMWLFLQS